MEIIELFKDSLTYPTKDWNKLLIFGVLFIIAGIFGLLQALGIALGQYIAANILEIISAIIFIIVGLIIYGYTLSIVRTTVKDTDDPLPDFDWGKNFIDGIKLAILHIVYYIIPVIITLIVAYATGAFNYFYQLAILSASTGSIQTAPESLVASAGLSFLTVFIIAAILFIIFGLLLLIAKAVLAETESLGAAANFSNVFKKIGKIGWGTYIIWLILFAIILIVIGIITTLINAIPFIGAIIVLLIVKSYTEIFSARTLGLIYNESKE
ncbi:hypothetical protein MBBAR_2c00510 [Methanobrevibacter arboriphilus JCM 13429 = DSM 1125]|uniref:DUF4013 domain-containing protein n=1 Tax=Methanobrevibacter arboriphilus JCM 13429 = DSM 1125 TaxID=1300164 RepID=A0A1V6N4U2_METAZ|nr:DUF4013 domain-containing protein [Methanobrevibacter arboriphilus]OQD59603.1 hypothetical protein MBBAR_2c00510 [Methanobrevibacter arboriphilus JCM 13429 = DSM 1125]